MVILYGGLGAFKISSPKTQRFIAEPNALTDSTTISFKDLP